MSDTSTSSPPDHQSAHSPGTGPKLPDKRTVSPWSIERQIPWLALFLVVAFTLVLNNLKLFSLMTAGLGFAFALIFFRDWIILAMYLCVAFSLEIDVTGTTSITLPTEALIPITVFAVGVSILVSGRIRYVPSPITVAIAAFFGLAIVSMAWSEEPISTIKAVIRESGYVLAGFYLFQFYATTKRRLIIFLIGTLITHLLLTLYGFGTQAMGGLRIYDDIAYPFFENHCIYAAYLVVTFCFLLAFAAVGTQGIWTTITSASALFIGLAIALTFVRAAWIAMAVVLVYFIIRLRMRTIAVDLIIGLLIVVSMVLLILVTTDIGKMMVERVTTMTDTNYVANYDRIDRWVAAYRMWQDHPILGVGYGAYPDVYEDYTFFKEAYSVEIRMGSHNLYLEILAELGIVGIIFYFFILGLFRYEATLVQHRSKDPILQACILGAKASLLSILVHAFFNNLGPSDKISMTFWFLFSLVLVCKRLQAEENDTVPERIPLSDTQAGVVAASTP